VEARCGGRLVAVAFVTRGVPPTPLASADLSGVVIPAAVAMVGHLAWRLLRDRPGDLIESRRRARAVFVAALAALLAADLIVDVVLSVDWRPQAFTITQNAAILVFAAAAGSWLVLADAERLRFRPSPAAAALAAADPAVARRRSRAQGARVGRGRARAPRSRT
jgi:hypothetical protein